MDKYEFNIKVEQIKKLVNKGDYETAMKIADGIDWRRVRSTSLLASISQVYERNEEYQEAKDILLLAFERAPIGKGLLFKLTDLALREGNVSEAEAYYREFCELCGEDPRQNLLRYLILEAKQAPLEQLIVSLERYCQNELDEKWLYKLAELYQKAGREEDCVRICDKLMLLFGLGKYVDKAMALKQKYAPLTKYQMDLVENREKYEEKLRAVEEEYSSGRRHREDEEIEADEDFDEPDDDSEAEEARRMAVGASLREEQAEKELAREISRIPQEEYHADDEEDSLGETRVLTDIRRVGREPEEGKAEALKQTAAASDSRTAGNAQAGAEEDRTSESEAARREEAIARAYEEEEETVIEDWDLEPVENDSNHLMIEARSPEKGMEIAIQTLKQIQKETGIKNPVAKITGSKLNKRGILACADKLSGKDLMIEEAGDLTPQMIGELETLMTRDTSGMRIILIDNPKQMEMLHAQNPSLADKFECIGCDYPPVQAAEPEVAAAEPESMAEPERESNLKQAERPVRKVVSTSNGAMRAPEPELEASEQEAAELAEPAEEAEMDIDEFAQYCCKYASEIDCSITGKSMLALYERIEIMEEDGIPLTRKEAQALIEEAADRAEKPSLGKAIKGLFSSKYDKDGMLILKEEHFI